MQNTDSTTKINSDYTQFYKSRNPDRVYPTEFVVRTFLAKYPGLKLNLEAGSKVLDLGFGDARNTMFLIEQGYDVHGIEISQEIVDLSMVRLSKFGMKADLKVGRNSAIPYTDEYFDIVLGCHVSYYCDDGQSFEDNLKEFARVLKPRAWFITSLPMRESYIFDGAEELSDGCLRIHKDPYNNRIGYKLKAFRSPEEISQELSPYFDNFSFASAQNNYYGIDERLYWVVCQKH